MLPCLKFGDPNSFASFDQMLNAKKGPMINSCTTRGLYIIFREGDFSRGDLCFYLPNTPFSNGELPLLHPIWF